MAWNVYLTDAQILPLRVSSLFVCRHQRVFAVVKAVFRNGPLYVAQSHTGTRIKSYHQNTGEVTHKMLKC